MATKTAPLSEPAHVVPPPSLAAAGATEGDERVWVRLPGSSEPQPCYAKGAKGRTITVNGFPCEHVGEGPDGAWVYEARLS